jgi:1-acyl-sn-glycerol-3-phosphate acyltransferase
LHGLTNVPAWRDHEPQSAGARAREKSFMERTATGFVRDIVLEGAAPAGAGTLFVSNHISWLDIPVIGATLDAEFIAKADVSGWPVIGTLSKRTGTIFVVREKRGDVHVQARAIANRLSAGGSLILFAEGTTSDGETILPFRSSLFEAATAAAQVQPLAIGYVHGSGRPLTAAERKKLGWVGDESLVANAREVAKLHLTAKLHLAPSFAPTAGMKRRDLAELCREHVAAAYAAISGNR